MASIICVPSALVRHTECKVHARTVAGPKRRAKCFSKKATVPSGWSATTSDGAGGEVDRLRNLGQAQNYNINVDHGALLELKKKDEFLFLSVHS